MRHILSFGAVTLMVVACGGVSNIGQGTGAEGNTGGSNNLGGKGTGNEPGSGGDTSGGGGFVGKGGDVGTGGDIGTGGSPNGCQTDSDCLTPGSCLMCSDGTQICQKSYCAGGQCISTLSMPVCPSPCDPAGCVSGPNSKGCCLPNQQGCGQDYGKGCEAAPKCDPTTCPAVPLPVGATRCCLPDGYTCGIDYGKGCTGPQTCDLSNCPFDPSKAEKPCCMADGACGVDVGKGCGFPNAQCNVDSDCPIPPTVCMPCADGSCAPAWTRCDAGKCASGIDQCPGSLHWTQTCGDPVCRIPDPPSGVQSCDPALGQKETGPCDKEGVTCDAGLGCGVLLRCSTSAPIACPLSASP